MKTVPTIKTMEFLMGCRRYDKFAYFPWIFARSLLRWFVRRFIRLMNGTVCMRVSVLADEQFFSSQQSTTFDLFVYRICVLLSFQWHACRLTTF